jgi:transposase
VVAAHCAACDALGVELARAHARIIELVAAGDALRVQLAETVKVTELQAADLARYKKLIEGQTTPHQPERVDRDRLQLVFAEMEEAKALATVVEDAKTAADAQAAAEEEPSAPTRSTPKGGGGGRGQRRVPDESKLRVLEERIVPEEVLASGGKGWRELTPEVTLRKAWRAAEVVWIRVVRTAWVRDDGDTGAARFAVAPVPDWALPSMKADASVIAPVVVQKYGVAQPLHRQEVLSKWMGEHVPRSSMSDWCAYAHGALSPIVEAMHQEALRDSFTIATDATSAPVRIDGGTVNWHMFVFVSDVGHVTFRHVRHHDSASIRGLLTGFTGHLLADAASIYDGLAQLGMTLLACWVHARRYFWKATLTESARAHEAMALIDRLFAIDAQSKRVPRAKRGELRATYARPVISALDAWVDRVNPAAEPGGRLRAALTYYENQREALHRFLDDGRIEMHNNGSERQLRALVMGLNNWQQFETKTGVAWYATFRSLIASCALHQLNPIEYVEDVLRLVRHWPAERVFELAPKYWMATRAGLDPRLRRALEPPWRRLDAPVSGPSVAA